MNDGVLLIGHGSKLAYNKEFVSHMADLIRSMNEFGPIATAFMQMDKPTIKEGIETLAEQGVDRIYVQPCFLANGIHLTEDIPRAIGLQGGGNETHVNVKGKDIVLKYCEPIGNDDRIALILEDQIRSRAQSS